MSGPCPHRLQQEVCECRARSEARLEEVVREGVERDLRLQALTDDCDKMRAELQRRQQENEQSVQNCIHHTM